MPYFKSERERQEFKDEAAAITFSTEFEGLLAEAAILAEQQRLAQRSLDEARDRARLAFHEVYTAAGSPRPHTPESAAFWHRWEQSCGPQ